MAKILKKTNKDNKFLKREEFRQNETGIKHEFQRSIEPASSRKKTPEWAINYKSSSASVVGLKLLAKNIERLHQIREKHLGAELSSLGEPVWKILIQLVIATEEQKIISVADIAGLISVPETTAVRYIDILVNKGHISRSQKPP